ncbi:ATP synthase F0 subunit B [Glutamicibacter sp. V16R2B1]|uniref:ATP synthase F0 subunit B n=1 Tax=Glutamicibacter sp. V16R2B1 TaxID=2036207 RepID=UPI0010FE7CA0|nr:ATP synthase F0 subunit B [Glutamicibacter sp. V16R2B1]TLK57087.1 ATP synthase F0 subunit B [Glutamicibacter sp. V16R2B1]
MSSNDYTTPEPNRNIPPTQVPDPLAGVNDPIVPPGEGAPLSEPVPPAEPVDTELTGLGTGTGVGTGTDDTDQSKAQEAASEAKDLAQEGKQSAAHVMDSAKQEASMVAEQARDKASNLLDELGSDVREQASAQQQKISANLRDISEEFRNMLDNSQASGTASSLVDQAAHHSGKVADWLEQREPGDLVEEIKGFARRRPGAFLGLALGAGLLAGRLTRNASGPDKDSDRDSRRDASPLHATQGSQDQYRDVSTDDVPPGMTRGQVPPEVTSQPTTQPRTVGMPETGTPGVLPGEPEPGSTYPPTPRRTDFE